MADTLVSDDPQRELAHRVSGGIAVTLYWSADDNSTSVEIFHAASEQTLRFTVPRKRALDAFYHPFAHVPAPADDHLVARTTDPGRNLPEQRH